MQNVVYNVYVYCIVSHRDLLESFTVIFTNNFYRIFRVIEKKDMSVFTPSRPDGVFFSPK